MEKWECTVCGWIYDPQKGDPTQGIEPGTSFEGLPDPWVCPECGAPKACSKRWDEVPHCGWRNRGITATRKRRSLDPSAEITIFQEEPCFYYPRPALISVLAEEKTLMNGKRDRSAHPRGEVLTGARCRSAMGERGSGGGRSWGTE